MSVHVYKVVTFPIDKAGATLALLLAALGPCLADEGMWTFDNPPTKVLQQKYGFTPTQAWLDHVRLASVRFNDGGSGSFVSPNGLVLTNHHVAADQLQKISTPQHDYLKSGFYAAKSADEMKSADLEINVLMSMENVTTRVLAAVKPSFDDQQAQKARLAEMAKIEKESLQKTGLRSDVVTLYHGAEYWLYRYKKYTDVRMVFAPEQQAAFFGGQPDNFTYPRYDLDMALFRVYENDKPIHTDNYLRWNSRGASDGELVFVSGNPGTTERDLTLAQLETQRDLSLPDILARVDSLLHALHDYSARGAEQARQATALIFELENDDKALGGELQGLKNSEIMAKKRDAESAFRIAIQRNPQLQKQYGGAWDRIAAAEQKFRPRAKEAHFRTLSPTFAETAMEIVRYVEEVRKPDSERLPGYHDAQLESLRFQLLSPAPVYLPMEQALLATVLEQAQRQLGGGDAFVKAALNGASSPAQAAAAVFQGTKLTDPAVRKALLEGGDSAVKASQDPLIAFARRVEPVLRETSEWVRNEIRSVESRAGEQLGQARFAIYGKSAYPDATFTLRLSYGTVKGYPMNGTVAPYQTTFYGLYDRSAGFGGKPPFDLTARYLTGKTTLDLAVPLNFVNTCDIIGGNSGSPVINRNGELAGLIFDGNIESLVGDFVYDERDNRAVAVHPGGMMEALRKLYHADALADELAGTKTKSVRTD
jgi:hypothetical protein